MGNPKQSFKTFRVGIAGAGLLGRVLALNCLQRGFQVELFDTDTCEGSQAAGMTAAGMLAPFAELETAESSIVQAGQRSMALWPGLLAQLDIADAYQQQGSLVTAYHADMADLTHFVTQLRSKVSETELTAQIQTLDRQAIAELEPELNAFSKAYFFPNEGQVDSHAFMVASQAYLKSHPNVIWHERHFVSKVTAGKVEGKSASKVVEAVFDQAFEAKFDHVFDVRGVGAKSDISGLRGVRGEVFWLDAPAVKLTRPVRIMHPRYRIYIVPRSNHRYVVGATEIESEDRSEMSVKSSLELLSAVYTVHPGFGEARIVKMLTNCRPALSNNLPKVEQLSRLTRINGLYRHGYLLAPAVIESALNSAFDKGLTNERD